MKLVLKLARSQRKDFAIMSQTRWKKGIVYDGSEWFWIFWGFGSQWEFFSVRCCIRRKHCHPVQCEHCCQALCPHGEPIRLGRRRAAMLLGIFPKPESARMIEIWTFSKLFLWKSPTSPSRSSRLAGRASGRGVVKLFPKDLFLSYKTKSFRWLR